MAGNEKNFKYFKYTDDNGFDWCLRGEDGGAGAGVDGHAAFDATDPVFGRITRRRHPRHVVATHAATHRSVTFVVYTAAAYAAIAGGDTISVQIPGSATAATFLVSAKNAEKMPIAKASSNLVDIT